MIEHYDLPGILSGKDGWPPRLATTEMRPYREMRNYLD
jgi:hypothetical protein